MKPNREILIELLKMRGSLSDEQAKTAADLFTELTGKEKSMLPEENLNEFLREIIGRALMLPVQMFLDRIPDEERLRLEKKLFM